MMGDERDDSSCGGSAESSVSQTTGTSHDKNHVNAASQQNMEAEEIERLVRKETRHVQLSRSFFLFLMLGATTVIVTLAYAVFNNQDRTEFVLAVRLWERGVGARLRSTPSTRRCSMTHFVLHFASYEQFNTTARTIQGSIYYQLKEAAGAGEMVGDSVTLSALATSSAWPYVTSHNFEFYARPWLEASSAVFMSFLPLVAGGGLIDSWNEYSVQNQDWINKSFQIADEDMPSSVASIAPGAYNLESVNGTLVQTNDTGRLPVVPLWQVSPPPLDSSPVNFNTLSAEWFRTPFLSKLPAIGDGTPALSILNLTLDTNEQTSEGSVVSSTDTEPQSLMLSPVFEKPKDNSSIVAVVWSLVPWSAYLTNALPTNVSSVVAVLRSSCDEQLAYCYKIDNNHATYLGETDTHDEMYDSYEFVVPLDPSALGDEERGAAEATSTPTCTYAFYLYPTKAYENPYVSDQPLTAAIWIAAVFIVLIVAFLIYERFTSAKNRKLVSVAARSNKLIATLFPEGVRERLFAEEENEERKAGGTVDHLKALLRDDPLAKAEGGVEGDDDDEETEVDLTSKPIADLFPEATILFADIVGFTSWSSIRQPSDVFVLLETLYKAFDKIADRRRIFKVRKCTFCWSAFSF
jgi:Adenylate and Guanylate cyclase catalytic domain